MSFRIDDILGKGGEKHIEKVEKWSRVPPLPSAVLPESILHKTLVDSSCSASHHYYSVLDEEHRQINYLENLQEYNKKYYPLQKYYSNYMENVALCGNIYPRYRYWMVNNNSPTLSGFFPTHFPHYSKRKGGQVRFTTSQTDLLEKRFSSHKYLSPEDRKVLASTLKLTDRQVKTWFQNRRAKWRRSVSSSGNSDYADDNEDIKDNSNNN